MVYLQLLILSVLAFVFYQDLKYRAVYWICFPILVVLFGVLKYTLVGLSSLVQDTGIALLFIGVQMLILWAYFSIKLGRTVNLSKEHLGWGDVLFLLALSFYLSPINYALFYVLSLILVLLFVLLNKAVTKSANPQIPLAGLQALLLAIAMGADYFTKGFQLYDDSWISI